MGERASADSLRWNLDLIRDQRGADMVAVPGGASGLLYSRALQPGHHVISRRPSATLHGLRHPRVDGANSSRLLPDAVVFTVSPARAAANLSPPR